MRWLHFDDGRLSTHIASEHLRTFQPLPFILVCQVTKVYDFRKVFGRNYDVAFDLLTNSGTEIEHKIEISLRGDFAGIEVELYLICNEKMSVDERATKVNPEKM